ncbi:MAG: aldo/keto reductase [Planctomycetales bacterium]|nr:aldo/keto reductase [Planctomycetales bacterium]
MQDTLTLVDGARLPRVGLGTWKIDADLLETLVPDAVSAGYRHLDCACDYGNEEAVGRGIRAAIQTGACRREELWVTSKLWNTFHRPEHVRAAAERSLRDLELEYLDLYLIHFPISLRFVTPETRYPPGWFFDPAASHPRMETEPVPIRDTWQAMEELVSSGLVRNLGVCNFGCSLIRDLLSYAHIRPAVLQVELHPYLTQEKLLRYCEQEQITVTAFSPLGAPSYIPLGMSRPEESVLADPVVAEIAQRCDRSPGQVVLRWALQRGTAVIPKTSQRERLAENISLIDFELTSDEMQAIGALDRQRRFNDPGDFCEAAFNTFFPIYE